MWTWTPSTPTYQATAFVPSHPPQPYTLHPKSTKTIVCMDSSSSPESQKNKSKPNPKNEEKQVNSSDLLWAWQKASTEKRKKKNIKKQQQLKNTYSKQWSSDSEEDNSPEGSDVRPLYIKSDWATRLDELEKRLRVLKITV